MADSHLTIPNPSNASRGVTLTRATPKHWGGAPAWWLEELARSARVAADHPTMARMRDTLLTRAAEYEAAAGKSRDGEAAA